MLLVAGCVISGLYSGGHNAAAVMASAFFCREQQLDGGWR
jgi:hypothetical protein